MADPVEPPTRSRNARACESCRLLKSRCIYKSEKEVCQRCEESGNTCLVRAKARPLRSRATRQGNNPGSTLSGSTNFSLDLPAIPSRDTLQDLEELNTHHKDIFGDQDRHSISAGRSDAQPLIKQRKLCVEEAEKLLLSFYDVAVFFPFVKIPPNTTVPQLSRTSPFLLLSILASASKTDLNLHRQLDHEYRRVLSQKIVIEGRKNLDFLQGLLVYIAWYPVHSNPRNSQTHVYMNLAISLASELGLDNDFPNSMSFTQIDTDGLVEGGVFTPAAKSAYLGCYCLSSVLSMGFQKPHSIQYRNLMDTRSQEFLEEIASSEIYYSVKLLRFWERLAEFYLVKDQQIATQPSALSPEIAMQTFQKELKDLRETIPEVLRNIISIGILDRFAQIAIYAYSLGFLRRPYKVMAETQTRPETDSRDYKCLEACKAFFEYLLTLPEENFHSFTTIHWTIVVHTTLILTRLTFDMAKNRGWDSNTTRSNIPMVMYLDCLCWRFQSLSSISDDEVRLPQSFDPLYIFRIILETLKKSYLRRVAEIKPPSITTNLASYSKGQCPIREPELKSYFESNFSQSSGSPDDSGSSTSSTIPVYFDIWTTMTGSWAAQ